MPAKQLRDLKPDFPDTDWYGDANIRDTYNGHHHNIVDLDSGLRLQERTAKVSSYMTTFQYSLLPRNLPYWSFHCNDKLCLANHKFQQPIYCLCNLSVAKNLQETFPRGGPLTHLPWTKWPPLCRRYIQMHFREWKVLYFGSSDNGLVPNRWQAIIWTNADLNHWHIYAALGRDQFMWLGVDNVTIIWFAIWCFIFIRTRVLKE